MFKPLIDYIKESANIEDPTLVEISAKHHKDSTWHFFRCEENNQLYFICFHSNGVLCSNVL